MPCKRCKCPKSPVKQEVTVKYYQKKDNEIVLDGNGDPVVLESVAELCDACVEFYENYTDPQGRKIDKIGSNFSIVKRSI